MTGAAEAADGPAFQLEDVTVRFGSVTALHRVSLDMRAGEQVGFVGPSGAGKTTLLRLLNASEEAGDGAVRVLGRRLDRLNGRDLKALRGEIGFIPQRFHLVPSLRVLQNVLMGRLGRQGFWSSARSLFFPSKSEQIAAYEVLARVGIGEKLFAKTDHLSGGQQQRVAIARAVYQEPKALLADEPVASVDPARAEATMELLTTLARERNLTLAVSLHDQALARAFLPRLIGIRQGTVFKDAPARDWADTDFEELYHLEKSELLDDGDGSRL